MSTPAPMDEKLARESVDAWERRDGKSERTTAYVTYLEAKGYLQALEDERKRVGPLLEYLTHQSECILSRWQAGEPTPDGGYRSMYAGEWYETKPIDKTPKCTCGLDELFSHYEGRTLGEKV